MNTITHITSDTHLDDIEHHFRVAAGPGAGKTYWLVEHIREVIRRSERLAGNTQVCCISYTNVAVNEIRSRLGNAGSRVEVSTIHSLLYRYIVKPHLHHLKDDAGDHLVSYALVSGHDEHRPHYKKVETWLREINQARLLRKETINDILKLLRDLQWELRDNSWQLCVNPKKHRFRFEQSHYFAYKKHYWAEGIIDHSDVLYFAHLLLSRYPQIARFFAARFPYLFVDEFQDTNPAQTQLITAAASERSVIGVIGDAEQSIYSFQQAQPEDFRTFHLPDCRYYTITDNHRSTNRIIALLNHVRSDGLTQQGSRDEEGVGITLLIGSKQAAVAYAQQRSANKLIVLARRHIHLAALQGITADNSDLWDDLEKRDPQRRLFLERLMQAVVLHKNRDPGQAIDLLNRTICSSKGVLRDPLRPDKHLVSQHIGRMAAMHLLRTAYTLTQAEHPLSLKAAYAQLDESLATQCAPIRLKGISKGGFADFAEHCTWTNLTTALRSTEKCHTIRTVHQAKAEEFEDVFVHVAEEKQLRNSLSSDPSLKDEEHRIFYVAISRAKQRLWIHLDQAHHPLPSILKTLSIETIYLDGTPPDERSPDDKPAKRQKKVSNKTQPPLDADGGEPLQGRLF